MICVDDIAQRMPGFLEPLFWEVDFSQVRLKDHERYVIERILEYGDDQAIIWLRKNVPTENIVEVIKHSREISPNTANLWALILDIPKEDIACLSIPSTNQPFRFSKK